MKFKVKQKVVLKHARFGIPRREVGKIATLEFISDSSRQDSPCMIKMLEPPRYYCIRLNDLIPYNNTKHNKQSLFDFMYD